MKDVIEILTTLGFKGFYRGKSFEFIRGDLVVALSDNSDLDKFSPNSSSIPNYLKISIPLSSKLDYSTLMIINHKDELDEFKVSDVLLYEIIFDIGLVKSNIVKFFQSEIRNKNLNYLLISPSSSSPEVDSD